jgi:hypothetical protein
VNKRLVKKKPDAVLRFKLPEDKEEFEVAAKSVDLYLALWDLDQWLRGKLKWDCEYKDAEEALDATRKHLNEIMDERGLHFEMMS